MCGNIACIAAVLLGIDVGWQPLPEGGLLYMIQIEPYLLEVLKSGEPIQSGVPSYVKDVRAYRIMVGTAELPRELAAEDIDSPASAAAAVDQPNVIEPAPDSKPIDAQAAGYLEQPSTKAKGESKSPSEQGPWQEGPQQDQTEKPWTFLIVALFTLFGSIGANVYLGWITWNTRSRYRSLVEARRYSELQ